MASPFLEPLFSGFECQKSPVLRPHPLEGVVDESRWAGGVLYFKIGPMEFSMTGLKTVPDWFIDGITVRLDFQYNSIELVPQ